jgi:hypothetical protein
MKNSSSSELMVSTVTVPMEPAPQAAFRPVETRWS